MFKLIMGNVRMITLPWLKNVAACYLSMLLAWEMLGELIQLSFLSFCAKLIRIILCFLRLLTRVRTVDKYHRSQDCLIVLMLLKFHKHIGLHLHSISFQRDGVVFKPVAVSCFLHNDVMCTAVLGHTNWILEGNSSSLHGFTKKCSLLWSQPMAGSETCMRSKESEEV